VETLSPGLTMSWIDRGADAPAQSGVVSAELAEAMKAEGQRRAEGGTSFGYMAYASRSARLSRNGWSAQLEFHYAD